MTANPKKVTWTSKDSHNLYNLSGWSEEYFDINSDGNLTVCTQHQSLVIAKLITSLQQQGATLPILMRFLDIIQCQLTRVADAFKQAAAIYQYQNNYRLAYPIKVNQQRAVIETMLQANTGLETGSRTELLVALGHAPIGTMIICNGYKDLEYIRLALIAQTLGMEIYLVVEKPNEVEHIVQCISTIGIIPKLGLRVRLNSVAMGKWQNTGGEEAKFGLQTYQVIAAVKQLEHANLSQYIQLLHFHCGSQITDIADLQPALAEGARYYQALREINVPIKAVDVGGGLGIDYDGTASSRQYSINYSLQDYANAIVQAFKQTGQYPDPALISESGRAVTAHHAMLVTSIVGSDSANPKPISPSDFPGDYTSNNAHVLSLAELAADTQKPPTLSLWQQATQQYQHIEQLFANAQINLHEKAYADRLYQNLRQRCAQPAAAKYIGNFSVFQSLPDAWAIQQLFPVVPLQKLHTQPSQPTTLHDLTCDSDGRIDEYVCDGKTAPALPLHPIDETGPTAYLLGIFLLGAYQECLGDMHNLIGTPTSVNIRLTGEVPYYHYTDLHPGDKTHEILHRTGADKDYLLKQFRRKIMTAQLKESQQRRYLQELNTQLDNHTYLKD